MEEQREGTLVFQFRGRSRGGHLEVIACANAPRTDSFTMYRTPHKDVRIAATQTAMRPVSPSGDEK